MAFEDLVRAQSVDGRMVGTEEERALLRAGTGRFGMTLEQADASLRSAVSGQRLVLQRDVDREVGDFMAAAVGQQGRLTPAVFDQGVALYSRRAERQLPDAQIRSRLKSIAERRGMVPARRGYLWPTRGWFDSIPPEAPSPGPRAEFVGPAAPPPADVSLQPAVRGEIVAFLESWGRAVSTSVVDNVLPLYDPQAVLLATVSPTPYQTREGLRPYFTRFLSNRNITVEWAEPFIVSDRFLVSASGLYTFEWDAAGPAAGGANGGGRTVTPARFTYVLRRNASSAWQILQHHSSELPAMNRPTAPAQPAAPAQ